VAYHFSTKNHLTDLNQNSNAAALPVLTKKKKNDFLAELNNINAIFISTAPVHWVSYISTVDV